MENQKLLKNLKCRGNLLALLLTLVASLFTYTSAWADNWSFWDNDAWALTVKYGSSTKTINSSGTTALGVVTSFSVNDYWCKTWQKENISNVCEVYVYYKFDSGSFQSEKCKVDQWGDWIPGDYPKTRNNTHYTNPSSITTSSLGDHTFEFYIQANGNNSSGSGCGDHRYINDGGNNYKVTFTIPGFSPSSASQTDFSCTAGSTQDKAISFTHYGTTLTKGDCSLTTGTDFEVSSISESGVTVTFKPTTSGTKDDELTITKDGKTCTITLKGEASAAGDAPTVLIADAPSVSGSVGTLFGYLKFTGCQNVTDFGFVWSTDEAVIRDTPSDGTQATATSPEKPIASGSYGTDFQAVGIEFTPQTTIYYKAYATNSVGTSYSDEYRSFQTSGCIKPVVTGITVPAQICSNAGTIEATATAIDGVTYAWSVDGTVFTEAEGTTNTATITVGAAGNGSITVTPTRTSDACVGDPYTLNNIEVVDMPLADPEITGDDAVCPNAESVTYTVAADGATTYAWTVTGAGWSITSGAATSTVTVKPGTEAGTLSVTVSNDCREKSENKAITLKPMPQKPGDISGNTTVCIKSDNTYSIEAVAGATGYEWEAPTGWTITGEGTSITATSGAEAEDGDIKVRSVNDCGKSEYSTLAVEVKGYNITLSDQGYITTPWDIFTLNATTDADASLVSWEWEYSGTLSDETLTVFETNGKTAKLKSGAPVSDEDKYTIKAKTTDGTCVIETEGYDVYVNAAPAEICN